MAGTIEDEAITFLDAVEEGGAGLSPSASVNTKP
jgi:hypothetical protein